MIGKESDVFTEEKTESVNSHFSDAENSDSTLTSKTSTSQVETLTTFDYYFGHLTYIASKIHADSANYVNSAEFDSISSVFRAIEDDLAIEHNFEDITAEETEDLVETAYNSFIDSHGTSTQGMDCLDLYVKCMIASGGHWSLCGTILGICLIIGPPSDNFSPPPAY